MNVHNHGPEESAGVLCGEQLAALTARLTVLESALREIGNLAADYMTDPLDRLYAIELALARAALEGQ